MSDTPSAKPRLPIWVLPALIGLFFAISLTVSTITVINALGPGRHGHAVTPDYYQRAVEHDHPAALPKKHSSV